MGVVHGDWAKGGLNFGFISPTWTRLLYLNFLVFTPSVLHARFLSAFLGVLCVPLTWVACKRFGFGSSVALLSALFLASDTSMAVANRQVLADTTVMTCLMQAFTLFAGSAKERLLSSVFLAAAICGKATAVFGAPVMYISQVSSAKAIQRPRFARHLRAMFLPLLALTFSGTCFLWLYAGHPDRFCAAWSYEFSYRRSMSAVYFNPFVDQGMVDAIKYYVMRMPLLIGTGVVGAVLMWKDRAKLNMLVLWWLVLGVAIIAVQNHQPHRYFVPVIPALCICAAWAVARLIGAASTPFARRSGAILAATVVLWSTGAWCHHYSMSNKHIEVVGPQVVAWINSNVPRNARVLGISLYGLGAHVDYFPQEVHCDPHKVDLSYAFIRRFRVQYCIYDDGWRRLTKIHHRGTERLLNDHFSLVKTIGSVSIWKLKPQAESPIVYSK